MNHKKLNFNFLYVMISIFLIILSQVSADEESTNLDVICTSSELELIFARHILPDVVFNHKFNFVFNQPQAYGNYSIPIGYVKGRPTNNDGVGNIFIISDGKFFEEIPFPSSPLPFTFQVEETVRYSSLLFSILIFIYKFFNFYLHYFMINFVSTINLRNFINRMSFFTFIIIFLKQQEVLKFLSSFKLEGVSLTVW